MMSGVERGTEDRVYEGMVTNPPTCAMSATPADSSLDAAEPMPR
jgi:hypothetical protein